MNILLLKRPFYSTLLHKNEIFPSPPLQIFSLSTFFHHIEARLCRLIYPPSPPSLLLHCACCTFEQNITVTLESHNRAHTAVIFSKRRPSSTWGFWASQVPHVSLRDLLARAAVSDHFQLDLHFAPRVPCWGGDAAGSLRWAVRLRNERSYANLDALGQMGHIGETENSDWLIKIGSWR